MRYLQAREILDVEGNRVGKWHYTSKRHDEVHPIGYCANGCPGHETAEEACEHYKEYMLDIASFTAQSWEREEPCRVCGAMTLGLAVIPGHHLPVTLCDLHSNRDGLSQAIGRVGTFILS